MQVEPVACGLATEGDHRGIGGGAVAGQGAHVLDLYAFDRLEVGQRRSEELEHGGARQQGARDQLGPGADEMSLVDEEVGHLGQQGHLDLRVHRPPRCAVERAGLARTRARSDPAPGHVEVLGSKRVEAE